MNRREPVVSHASGTHTVKSIQCYESFVLSGGSLTISNTLQVDNTFALSGGTLIRATVLQGTNGQGIVAITSGGTLDGVTLSGDLDVGNSVDGPQVTVTNGLVLNGTLRLGNPTNQWHGLVNFYGSQTLSGNGTVIFGNHWAYNSLRLNLANTTLTVAPTVTVRGHTGVIGYNSAWGGPANVSVVNQGTISADVNGGHIYIGGQSFNNNALVEVRNGAKVTLGGPWFNPPPGLIRVYQGTLDLIGPVNRADMGSVENVGGTVLLTGTLSNTGSNLAFSGQTGSWTLNGGTIRGGTIVETNGARLICTGNGGRLDGVTFNGDLDVGNNINGAHLTVTNGLVLNGTLRLGNPTNQWYGLVHFDGSQTLSGNGTVIVGNHWGYNALRLIVANTTLTLGPGITVRGQTGTLGYASAWSGPPNVHVINQGAILAADVPGGVLYLTGQMLVNEGHIVQTNGAQVRLQGTVVNSGQISPGTGIVDVTGTFTQSQLRPAPPGLRGRERYSPGRRTSAGVLPSRDSADKLEFLQPPLARISRLASRHPRWSVSDAWRILGGAHFPDWFLRPGCGPPHRSRQPRVPRPDHTHSFAAP